MTQKLFSFLKSLLILLALGLSSVVLFIGNVSANETVDNSRNMTSDEFIINLSELDPINKSKSTPQWREALIQILKKVSDFLLMMIPIIAAVALIIAGYFYIFSPAHSESVTKAKGIIKFNLIAILVAFFSYSLVQLIVNLLNASGNN